MEQPCWIKIDISEPGALIMNMTRQQFLRILDRNLQSLLETIGVNNRMGSLLTRHPGYMGWLMESLNATAYFILIVLLANKVLPA